MSELKLFQKSYDFLIWVFTKTDGFPKSKRFSIGQRLENLFLDFIVLVNGLAYTRKRERKIVEISAIFDQIKLLLRLAHDTKLLSRDSFAFSLGFTEEIGAMIGGYMKQAKQARTG
jgi:hypothetical protein